MSTHRIAVIAGDGIGKEVMPEGVRVMEAAASRFGIDLAFDHFDFSSWDYYEKHGKMMPDDWKDQIGGHDAIYFGAVGWPEKIPDHVSLWGSLLLFRREFDQYVNLRPARLMPGIIAPVVRRDGSARQPGEIDMYIVRENTEGEYSSIGGRMYPGHRARDCHAGDSDVARRRGPSAEVRIRAGAVAAQEAPDQRHQVQRHRHHHAVLGRARGRDGQGLSGRQGRQVPHRHPDRAFRAAARLLRRGGGEQPVRRHPERPGAGLHRHHRHRAEREPQSRPQVSRRCSSRCTARRPTSPGATSPTRSARSGAAR